MIFEIPKDTEVLQIDITELKKQIRSDAIDDFVQKIKEHHYVLSDVINSTDYGMFTVGIEQIAEQLKAGGTYGIEIN